MSDYRFSTVRIIPDLIRGEPLNIGAILHDVDNSTIYRRFTKNWTEVKRRAGIERLPHANGPASIENKEFLDALSAKAGKNSLVVTKPKPVSPINTPQETLDALFKVQVSLPVELSGIQTVYRKDHVYELDRIHKIVSVTAVSHTRGSLRPAYKSVRVGQVS